jgi:hypothetical protein
MKLLKWARHEHPPEAAKAAENVGAVADLADPCEPTRSRWH